MESARHPYKGKNMLGYRRSTIAVASFLLTLALMAAVAWSQSAGTSAATTGPAAGQAAKPAPRAATSKPASPVKSKYLARIDKDKYPPAKVPAAAPLLRWNFSGETVYAYDYLQLVDNNSRMGGPMGPMTTTQNLHGSGMLLMQSRGDRTGAMVLKDMLISAKVSMNAPGQASQPQVMKQKMPPVVMQGFKEDGTMTASARGVQQEALMRLLFPLPPKPLKVGESVAIPVSIPFNASGTVLPVKGSCKVTLAGYVSRDGRTCARLVSDIDVSDLKVPKEMPGKYRFVTRGKGIMYFDLRQRCFASSALAVTMELSVEAPTPIPPAAAKDPRLPAMPARLKMNMAADNLIRVQRTSYQQLAQKEAQ